MPLINSRVVNLLLIFQQVVDIQSLQREQLAAEKGGRKGFKVWVYDNTILVNGKPFETYGAANQFLGLNKNSRTIARKIDTGQKYKNQYTFYSTPQEH